eukprot:483632-Rhodomonas_salina.1
MPRITPTFLVLFASFHPLVVFSCTPATPASGNPLAFVTSFPVSRFSHITTCNPSFCDQKYTAKYFFGMKRAAAATLSHRGGKQSKTFASMTSNSDLQTQAEKILLIEAELLQKLEKLPPFKSKGVEYVYNPLIYAAETHQDYVRKYGNGAGLPPFPLALQPQTRAMLTYMLAAQCGISLWE